MTTDAEIEVRQLFELEDFEPGVSIEPFREMDAACSVNAAAAGEA